MSNLIKAALAAITASTLSGCVWLGPIGDPDLPKGLNISQIENKLQGCANVVTKRGHYEGRTYNTRMPNFFQWDPATYVVIMKDGAVIDYGQGTVHETVIASEPALERTPPAPAVKTAATDARLASSSCANQTVG